MKEIFATTIDEMEDLEMEYDLEDCGMSGRYPSHHWYQDDEAEVAVYFKLEEE